MDFWGLNDPELTGNTQDLWPLPSARWQASGQGIQPLLVTQSTAITHNCVCLVSLSNLSKNWGVSDFGWWSAWGCGRFMSSLNHEAWRLEGNAAAVTHRCLSCRCMRGDSCRARHSSVLHRATPSLRSPHLTGNSCLVAPCTSSHTAACINNKGYRRIINHRNAAFFLSTWLSMNERNMFPEADLFFFWGYVDSIKFSFIYKPSFAIKIVSGCFKETRNLTPKEARIKPHFNRKKPRAGPGSYRGPSCWWLAG